MSLFGSIQMGGSTLQAMQIGLQVVGNNIANANTPGYVREEAIFVPAPVQHQGSLVLGLGVQVDSIVQKIDKFVQERLVGAKGDRANAEVQEQTYREMETVLNELSDSVDLSSALTGFFNSVDEVMKDPGNAATRNLAVGKGIALDREHQQSEQPRVGRADAARPARVGGCKRNQQPGRADSEAERANRLDRRRRFIGEPGRRAARQAANRRSIGCRNCSASTLRSSRAAA